MPNWVFYLLYVICFLEPIAVLDPPLLRYLYVPFCLVLLSIPLVIRKPKIFRYLYRWLFFPRFTLGDFLKFDHIPIFIPHDIRMSPIQKTVKYRK